MRNCDLDLRLEDVLQKFSKEFQKKILHSVELIRKAEPLALAYDPNDGFFNTFSGGKDSQCLYHIVKMAGVKHKTHMNLTSVDPPEVIRFVKTEYPDVVLAKPKDSIFHLAMKKNILPTMRVRWCCAEYKEMAGAGKVTLIGIRHSESTRRAKRNEVELSNHAYSGDLNGLDEYRKQRNSGRKPRKGKFSIINVNGESEVGCIHGKESLLISPIIDWTEDDVWTFLNTLGIKHCCLYDEGFTRIGCILCPMSRRSQKEIDMKRWPHVKRNWIKAIKEIRRGGYSQTDIYGGTSQSVLHRFQAQDGGSELETNRTDVCKGVHSTAGAPVKQTLHRGGGYQEKPKSSLSDSKRMAPSQRRLDFYKSNHWLDGAGFSDGVSPDGLTEAQENEIAENIFDWWISGKAYKKWYTEKFLQQNMFDSIGNDKED